MIASIMVPCTVRGDTVSGDIVQLLYRQYNGSVRPDRFVWQASTDGVDVLLGRCGNEYSGQYPEHLTVIHNRRPYNFKLFTVVPHYNNLSVFTRPADLNPDWDALSRMHRELGWDVLQRR